MNDKLYPSYNSEDAIAAFFEETGKALVQESSNKPLRNIQKCIWQWREEVVENESAQFNLLVFFLEAFTDRIFYNLSGDVPYVPEVTKEIQSQFYKTVGVILQDLSNNLRARNDNGLYMCFAKMATAYFETVKALNKNP